MAEKFDCFCGHVGKTNLANNLTLTYPTIKTKIKAKYSATREMEAHEFDHEEKVKSVGYCLFFFNFFSFLLSLFLIG